MNSRDFMLQALLFDLDGTLVHTDPMHLATWQDILQEFNIAVDAAFFNAHFSGRTNAEILQELLPQLSASEHKQLGDRKEARFREQAHTLQPLPGLLDLITWMQAQSLQRAIVTNAPQANAHHMLEALGLVDIFPVVVLAEELPRGKPDPLPYQTALQRLGVEADAALVFEDSPSGIRAAVAAGIPTVAIASGHSPETLQAFGPTLVIPDFTDLRLDALLRRTLEPQPLGASADGVRNAPHQRKFAG